MSRGASEKISLPGKTGQFFFQTKVYSSDLGTRNKSPRNKVSVTQVLLGTNSDYNSEYCKDISYLSEKNAKTIQLPPSQIPEKHHVIEKTLTPPSDRTLHAVYDGSDENLIYLFEIGTELNRKRKVVAYHYFSECPAFREERCFTLGSMVESNAATKSF
jgi:hypothetical protein